MEHEHRRPLHRQHAVDRRHLQIALGLLWLLDGGLQLQPFMFGTGFAREIIAPAAAGQPHVVAAAVRWAAGLIASHPVFFDALIASGQLLLGLGLLVPRTARLALAASIPWALGVWIFGEALSGLASGHASLLTGAPGAALLYGVLALAAFGRPSDAPGRWLRLAWAVLWIGGAVLQSLPDQNTEHALVVAETLIGLGALHRKTRVPAAAAGLVFAVTMWVVAQDLGGLFSGRATDPNTGPLIALMAVALLGPIGLWLPACRRRPAQGFFAAQSRAASSSMRSSRS